mmetsp:Transcript_16112/g.28612  ORF Transcript_16112/g.28612 Transcript_16112/m.28612 type:complete len:202 (+) Transcript_16112:117-722(+)
MRPRSGQATNFGLGNFIREFFHIRDDEIYMVGTEQWIDCTGMSGYLGLHHDGDVWWGPHHKAKLGCGGLVKFFRDPEKAITRLCIFAALQHFRNVTCPAVHEGDGCLIFVGCITPHDWAGVRTNLFYCCVKGVSIFNGHASTFDHLKLCARVRFEFRFGGVRVATSEREPHPTEIHPLGLFLGNMIFGHGKLRDKVAQNVF